MNVPSIFKVLWKVIKVIFIAIYRFFDSFKFVWSIPALSLAASAFGLLVIFLLNPFVSVVLGFVVPWFITTGIIAGIFIYLKFIIFKDKLDHDLEFEHDKYLYTFMPTVIIWSIPILLMGASTGLLIDFFDSGVFGSVTTTLFIIFYLPHTWLAAITSEYLYSTIAGLIINCFVFFVISKIAIRNAFGDIIDDIKNREKENDEKSFDNTNES